jgi:ketosteroid isomerase-like protein
MNDEFWGAPNATETMNIALIREYLSSLEGGDVGQALTRFFTDDAVQEEFPNRLNPTGGRSDLGTIVERSELGKQILRSQSYDIRSTIASGVEVAVEAEWRATLAVPVGPLPAGSEMRAHLAMFFELSEGRIRRQRNYDCFEPW